MNILSGLLEDLPKNSSVLDYGCLGWYLTKISSRKDIKHHGCDTSKPNNIPEGAVFHEVDTVARKISIQDDYFDLVVASHVLEHVYDPLELFQELTRVCKPGGLIYIETPSDKSVSVKSDPDVESHSFYSFWDDPTHIRPWTPAALYRLALSHGCDPIQTSYIGTLKDKLLYPLRRLRYSFPKNGHKITDAVWLANQWSCYCLAIKPKDVKGKPVYKYLSFKDVAKGKKAAFDYYKS